MTNRINPPKESGIEKKVGATKMNIVTTEEAKKGFYPTPANLANVMLKNIDWQLVDVVLEPSAGKGDLALAVAKAWHRSRGRDEPHIDCIELDPYLRQILKYNFSEEKKSVIYKEYKEIDNKLYSDRTKSEEITRSQKLEEYELLKSINLNVVHDDFLTYHANTKYSLIVMNPPFADGDKHLLKALELQKNGGQIVCLLNAETIRNPFSNTRKVLISELDKYSAQITFHSGEFLNAERQTDVDIALVEINIPKAQQQSYFYENMKKAEEEKAPEYSPQELVAADYIEQRVQMYNVEVNATRAFIREYEALKPYMARELDSRDSFGSDPILTLVVERDSSFSTFDVNRYMRVVRLKYWKSLFQNERFTGKLTSKLREEYMSLVNKMADYDFTLFNIQQVLADMNASLSAGVQETIMLLFDKLTADHTWYPECQNNKHYFNGWKTNQAHKIGKKSIIPTNGMFSDRSWDKNAFDVSTAYKVISDIEKAFNYLDGNMTADVDLQSVLAKANAEGQTKNIECKYFKVTMYKKGTTHITFTNMDLVEKLNIYAARNKKWLPPNYGRAKYSEMNKEEKAVIDDFQGEKAYEQIMARSSYYLVEPENQMKLLN